MYSFISSSEIIWRITSPVLQLIKLKHWEISNFPKVTLGEVRIWTQFIWLQSTCSSPLGGAGRGGLSQAVSWETQSLAFFLLRDLWALSHKLQLCLLSLLITNNIPATPWIWTPQPQRLPETWVIPSQGSRISSLEEACHLHPLKSR